VTVSQYGVAKAIKEGMHLWCIWSPTQPFTFTEDKNGFVVADAKDMRRMAHDLLRLADELDGMNFWENDD
jgi:hypothetical protein